MDRRTFMRSATALATAGAMLGADALVQAASLYSGMDLRKNF